MRKLLTKSSASLALAAALAANVCTGVFATPGVPTFTDVPEEHWAFATVEQAAENGWVNGIGDDLFAPEGTLTFAEFYTMMVRVFAADELAAYETPADSPWWQSYMYVGATNLQAHTITNDLTHDETEVAVPDSEDALLASISEHAEEPITRSDAISIMWQVLVKTGLAEQITGIEEAKAEIAVVNGELTAPDDVSVPVCYAAGLISGNERGELNLSNTLTRAEGCTMMCNLADYVAAAAETGEGETAEPGEDEADENGLGQKLDSGATAAAGVLPTIGKSDDYPTFSNANVASPNGYFTGAANAEIGAAELQYELLDLVNETRTAEKHEALTWVDSDAAEEYTLVRCFALAADPDSEGAFAEEVATAGGSDVHEIFDSLMNAPGLKSLLMEDSALYLSAARVENDGEYTWVICVWDESGIDLAESWSPASYIITSAEND